MNNLWLWAIGSSLVISLISLVGLFSLPFSNRTLKRLTFVLVSLAIGGLYGDAFIHLLPEAYASGNSHLTNACLILLGVLVFLLIEKIFHWHHHHNCENPEHHQIKAAVYPVIFGDTLHNLIDGLLLGAAFLVSVPAGLATALAIILHEIPQEIGDFGVLISMGYTRMKALYVNFFSALAATLGVVLAFVLGSYSTNLAEVFIPITAGGFIYIAGTDLLPELKEHHTPKKIIIQFVAIIAGVGFMALMTLIEK